MTAACLALRSFYSTQSKVNRLLEVCTGSRLHFGLVELADGQPLRFGGLGLMLEQPDMCLRLTTERQQQSSRGDEISQKLEQAFATLAQAEPDFASFPVGRLLLSRTLPSHSGLGSGTQTTCAAIAAALLSRDRSIDAKCEISDCLPNLDASTLSQLTGRGARSGIGLQGFLTGGLILDQGHSPHANERRVKTEVTYLPEDWRVLLLRPAYENHRISGQREAELLRQVATQPNLQRDEMWTHARTTFASSSQGHFEGFVSNLERYLSLASQIFAPVQNGEFNGENLTDLAAVARRCGLRAVGQSSWGPTLFGFCETPQLAEQLAESILKAAGSPVEVQVATPASQGATVNTQLQNSESQL